MRVLLLVLPLLVLPVLLAACVTGPSPPPEGTPFVEVSNTGSIHGADVTRIYRGDLLYTSSFEGAPDTGRESWRPARPGVFDEVTALVAAKGPGVARRVREPSEVCMDAGISRVKAVPPAGRFSEVSSSCPDPVLTGFMTEVLAAARAGTP